ncbi:major capsid protein [Pseudovibrio ascidiaceicola]|uniref:major capsid protein n=1 Tax=Pseudovibrio ascidiaceicola TaxID=285279 RepID=UPI000D69535C|nr:major capsid protein [Pseudovibrio ascidiaceicola]
MSSIWNDDKFSVHSLTASINEQPSVPDQIGKSGLFEEDGVNTTYIDIERQGNDLQLVEPTPRGGPGETTGDEVRTMETFKIPHYQRDDHVTADEVQNVREFGTDNQLEGLRERVVSKGGRHARDLDNTLEHQRIGAISGIVTTAKGVVLANLYQKFGYAVPPALDLDHSNSDLKLGRFLKHALYGIEDDLDRNYGHMHVYTGRDLHEWIWFRPEVQDRFKNTAEAQTLLEDVPETFNYAGFKFERYKQGRKAREAGGGTYIAHNEARVVPFGVQDLFLTRFAPADYEETVNTKGLPLYMRQYPDPNGKGRSLEVQMNPISLCTNPSVLRKIRLQNYSPS